MQTTDISTNTTKGPFVAVTLTPSGYAPASLGIERQALLDELNRPPADGTIGIIPGPPRSGRTTLAMQWMVKNDAQCQYVCATRIPEVPEEWISPAGELGTSTADLLNLCCSPDLDPKDPAVIEAVKKFASELEISKDHLIIDEFGPARLDLIEPLLTEQLTKHPTPQVLAIIGPEDSECFSVLERFGQVRFILGTVLNFSREEARMLYADSPDCHLEIDQLHEALTETGGWIHGLKQHGCTRPTFETDLDTLLLNRLTMRLPQPYRQFLAHVAPLPQQSLQLWDRLATVNNLSIDRLTDIIPHIPLSNSIGDDGIIEIVPMVAKSLRRQSLLLRNQDAFVATVLEAVRFYMEEDDVAFACQAASLIQAEKDVAEMALQRVKQIIAAQNWGELDEYLTQIPTTITTINDDLYGWSLFNSFIMMRTSGPGDDGHDLIDTWFNSDQPYLQGRAYLFHAAHFWTIGDAPQTGSSAMKALELLPASQRVERLMGYSLAVRAQAYERADVDTYGLIREYIIATSYLREDERWAEAVTAPLTLGVIGTWGRLKDAEDFCSQMIINSLETPSIEQTGYLLLQALIQIEYCRFDEAARLIQQAENLNSIPAMRSYVAYAKAQLALTSGDLNAAEEHLQELQAKSLRDNPQHQMVPLMRAQIALRQNDHARAQMLIQFQGPIGDTWPNVFLAEHHQLVRATILCMRGKYEQATLQAEAVVKEARRRTHRIFEVSGLATLAYIAHMSGNRVLRDSYIHKVAAMAEEYGFKRSLRVAGVDICELYSHRAIIPLLSPPAAPSQTTQLHGRLTARERQALALAAHGLSNAEISATMKVSRSTVKNHLTNAFSKLSVDNRKQAVLKARSLNLIPSMAEMSD